MAIKIYIAGKISGEPDYKSIFEEAASEYEKRGYTVLSPSWMPSGMTASDYMRICFAMIDTADAVVFLPGYEASPGALLELQYCRYVGKAVRMPMINQGNDDCKEQELCKMTDL